MVPKDTIFYSVSRFVLFLVILSFRMGRYPETNFVRVYIYLPISPQDSFQTTFQSTFRGPASSPKTNPASCTSHLAHSTHFEALSASSGTIQAVWRMTDGMTELRKDIFYLLQIVILYDIVLFLSIDYGRNRLSRNISMLGGIFLHPFG